MSKFLFYFYFVQTTFCATYLEKHLSKYHQVGEKENEQPGCEAMIVEQSVEVKNLYY